MKKILLCFFLLACLYTEGQKSDFSFQSLVDFTNLHGKQFESYIARKGFKPDPSEINPGIYYKKEKKGSIERQIEKFEHEDSGSIIFQTTCKQEFLGLAQQLQQEGYASTKENLVCENVSALYQKRHIIIEPKIEQAEDKTLYSYIIQKKNLPAARNIVYAEDLLQLTSHEYIAAVFGENNVRKDVFYFSEKEQNKCSILFPNTNMQVIFIWKDETNRRDISFLIIGGQLKAGSGTSYRQVEQNKWHSLNGVYKGMSLKELFRLNGSPINFYGWESDEAGFVMRDNKGTIDFKKTGVKLTCLDCNEDQFYSDSNIISSSALLNQNRRAFVSALVITP